MLFPTIDFAIFFMVVFAGNWMLRPRPVAWKLFILGASLFFYAYFFVYDEVAGFDFHDWTYALVLPASILGNWIVGNAVAGALGPDGERTLQSKRYVRLGVVANLLFIAVFKYFVFVRGNVLGALPDWGLVLPIGISFFTFQAISYVVDIGRGEWKRPMTLLDFGVYLSFFAHLVAGPIVRASEFAWQIEARPDPRRVESSEAFMLIFRGLFKKVVISSYMATIVDPVFNLPDAHSSWEVLWGIYAYAIQIYADFSGYTDIAIGVALLLGIRFPQNFDAPYRSLSIQEFWRRWHMTLSRWLRDYLYIPLGGNRGSRLVSLFNPVLGGRALPRFLYLNLFLTMLLGGLWHGANWTFLIWGAIQGGALIAERVVKQRWQARGALGLPVRLVQTLQWLLTFNIVAFAWVFFRAQSFGDALDVLGALAPSSGGVTELVTPLVIVTILLMLASQFVPPRIPLRVQVAFGQLAPALQIVAVAVAIVGINALGPEGIAPFIYFQF